VASMMTSTLASSSMGVIVASDPIRGNPADIRRRPHEGQHGHRRPRSRPLPRVRCFMRRALIHAEIG
jgi:hypothetical protein